MNKKIIILSTLAFLLLVIAGVAWAAFGDRGEILGSSFSVGSADLKLLQDLAGGTEEENLVDELPGPSFSGIHPDWIADYGMKIYNNGTEEVVVTSNADYETVNDPEDLRQIIYVEPYTWNDPNGNGIPDPEEFGISFGRKTIVKWKTEGYDFGNLGSGSVMGLVLRFSTDSVPDSKQGASAIFDFLFDSVGL